MSQSEPKKMSKVVVQATEYMTALSILLKELEDTSHENSIQFERVAQAVKLLQDGVDMKTSLSLHQSRTQFKLKTNQSKLH